MRAILLTIPLKGTVNIGGWELPLFGPGLVLAVWLLLGLIVFGLQFRSEGGKALSSANFFTWLIACGLIFLAPALGNEIPIYGYGTMLFVGFFTATAWASWRLKQQGADPELAWDVATWIFIGGIVGARLFFVTQYHERVFQNDTHLGQMLFSMIRLWDGGLVFYGGMILGAVAYGLFCYVRRVHPLALADVLISSVLLGMAFGRIGCLLYGCCYGDQCELPWAITFPAGSIPFVAEVQQGFLEVDASRSLPLHPTQIYSSLSAGLLALLTWAFYPYRRWNGEVLALGWMLYPITRFLVEFLRGDEPGQLGTSLTISQLISIGLVASGVVFYLCIRRG